MRRLQRCREVWGTSERSDALPELRFAQDALYLPGAGGGLFAEGRSLHGPDRAVPEPYAGAAPGSLEPAPARTYLYLGPLITHYGHFIIETLSRLWPLLIWDGPPPILLCHRSGAEAEEPAFIGEMLAGLGIPPSGLVSFDRPVRIAHVAIPEASFHERARVHAIFGELCRQIGRPHWSSDQVDTAGGLVYLSKSRLVAGMGRLVNEAAVTDELARCGVGIVYPEELDFPGKIRLLAAQRVIMGTAASAFHTAAFSAPERRIVGLNWAHHVNANFPLFDDLAGTRARYYWVLGTRYAPVENFGIGWTIPEPERVAHELLGRAQTFEHLDERDAADEAEAARRARRPAARIARWRRALARRLDQAFAGLRRT